MPRLSLAEYTEGAEKSKVKSNISRGDNLSRSDSSKAEGIVVLKFSPRSLRSLVSMRTGEKSCYAVIPETILIGNPDFICAKDWIPDRILRG